MSTGPVRALVWEGAEGFALETFARPVPGPGEILVRVRAAAICGSDRHTTAGRRPGEHPAILGHEGTGTIEALGPRPGAEGLRVPSGHPWGWAIASPGR